MFISSLSSLRAAFTPCLIAALTATHLGVTAAHAAPAGYTLVWSDEFDGTALDANTWNVLTGPYVDGVRTADAIAVSGGLLRITTYTENNVHYTAFLDTRNKYNPLYGYIEVRMESLINSGVNHAFWLQGPTVGSMIGDPWNAGSEIDIVEHRYQTPSGYHADQATAAVHWDGYRSALKSRGSKLLGAGLDVGFHTYGVEWTPNLLRFYYDGVPVYTLTNTTNANETDLTKAPIPQRSEFIYLTAAVRSGAFAGPTLPLPVGYGSQATSTTRMNVDYVRVYQLNPTAPAVPTDFVVGSGNGQAALRWTLSANAETHTIKRATTRGGPYTTVASGITGDHYTDTGLTNGARYYYRVSAVSSVGESADSAERAAAPMETPISRVVDNSDPTGVLITGAWTGSTGASGYYGKNFLHDGDTGSVGGKSVRFTPTLPATTDYDVYLNWTSAGNRSIRIPVDIVHTGGTSTVYVNQTVDGGAWYLLGTFSFSAGETGAVRVRNDLNGGYGHVVADAAKFVQLALPPPTGLSAGAVSSSQINLAWTASNGAAGYNVKRASESGGPYTLVAGGVTTTSYMDAGLDHNRTYYYVVSAANSTAVSADSAEAGARTPPPVPAVAVGNAGNGKVIMDRNGPPGVDIVQHPFAPPTGLGAATVSNSRIDLTWTSSSAASFYNVKRSETSGGPFVTIATNVTATSYTDAALVPGTTYYYVVSSAKPAGQGPNSAETSATTSPSVPAGLIAAAGNARVTLTWSAAPGATHYRVKRSGSSGGAYSVIAEPMTPTYTDTALNNGAVYYYVVSAVNGGGEGPDSSEMPATPQESVTIIKDNSDPTGIATTGAWTGATSTAGFYGGNYLHDGNTGATGGKKVKFIPDLPVTASYEVYARWTSFSNRASNAPIDVTHAEGTTTVTVNQRTNNGTWVLLGTFPFNAGTSGSVTVRNDGADGFVVADAVRLISK